MNSLTIGRFGFEDDAPDQFFILCVAPMQGGGNLHDVVAGPYPTREEASSARERMQATDIDPIARLTEFRDAHLAGEGHDGQ